MRPIGIGPNIERRPKRPNGIHIHDHWRVTGNNPTKVDRLMKGLDGFLERDRGRKFLD